MSGQWETVVRKKDKSNKTASIDNNKPKNFKNKQSNILNNVKIEEILPKSQMNSIYANVKGKEEKNTQKTKNPNVKKSEQKPNKINKEPLKPKPPKSIESALTLIDVTEFSSIFERTKSLYPDAPILWLKELTDYLNHKIPVEVPDPVFSNKPSGFPLSAAPSEIKLVIEKSVKEAGKGNIQTFFDIALTSLATDLSKGLPAVGYRFFLQHIATKEPQLVLLNLGKHKLLRNSYQNRSNITLPIFWALGHTGIDDLHSGLKVFEELMLPTIDMKNYTQYVTKYLIDLLGYNHDTSISNDQYFLILDALLSNKKSSGSKQLTKQLGDTHSYVQTLLFKNMKELNGQLVERFLKKISANGNKTYQDCLCDTLVALFSRDHNALGEWLRLYPKYVSPSAVLFNYIDRNFDKLKNLIKQGALKECLLKFEQQNEELSLRKKKEQGLADAVLLTRRILERLERQKMPRSSGGLLKFLVVLGLLGASLEVYIKMRQGRFEESSLYKANTVIIDGSTWVNARAKETFPEQYKLVVTFVEPYADLFRDVGKVLGVAVLNLWSSVTPHVRDHYSSLEKTVEKHFPGLVNQTENAYNLVSSKVVSYCNITLEYLQTKLPVDQLSTTSVQRIVTEVSKVTFHKVTEYYVWAFEKVQSIVK
ncbi:transmembrane protein 214 [Cylas formicarius]|uniref:transmembrane protein 214 n=1 Tax=Cylas formicarius TaxID=197179 RepID=UPI0029588A6D|nr:transmembrane protein 214 [Cylas formicarius]XP_060536012.1 transmembrane protein 214 [Cylas formicarius]